MTYLLINIGTQQLKKDNLFTRIKKI